MKTYWKTSQNFFDLSRAPKIMILISIYTSGTDCDTYLCCMYVCIVNDLSVNAEKDVDNPVMIIRNPDSNASAVYVWLDIEVLEIVME